MPAGAIPFPFGDCRVCGDKATGVHYGVATCEGCKGFFKRSIPKADKYKCFYHGQCTLNPQERNRCKSCRFRRCLEVGMSVDGVKMGRIPKLEKEKALEEHRKGLEQKAVDALGMTTQQLQDDNNMVAAHTAGSVGDQHSPWRMEEVSSPLHPSNRPLVEMSHKDKVIGNRCPSIDSGIDDDVRDLSEKRKTQTNRCWQSVNETVEFGETASDSAGECNAGLGNDYLPQDRPKMPGKQETRGAAKFQSLGESADDWLGLNSSDAGIRSNHSGSDYQSDQAHSMNSYSTYDNKSIEDVQLTSLASSTSSSLSSSSSSSCSSGSEAGVLARKVLSVTPATHSGLPFYPTVIKELLNQVIETGHAKELQQNLVRQFLSASDSADLRPEMWLQCLSNSQTGSGDFASEQSLVGTCSVAGSPDKGQPRTLKRKAASSADDEDSDSGKGLARNGQCSSHQGGEEEEEEEQIVDSSASPFPDVSVVAASGGGSHDAETTQLLTNDIRKSENHKTTNMRKRSKNEPLEAARRLMDGSKKSNLFTVATCDPANSVKSTSVIPGAECPARMQRMKQIEAMASRVPQLTFWDIPENTLGALTAAQPLAGTEIEQCKREIEQVLEWLKVVGNRFTEKSRLDLSIWDEEVAGLRPVHPLNLLTNLTQKDIGIYWEEIIGCVPLCNFLILGLCSSIPGFNQLDPDDRAVLMETAYFDLWIILLSSLFHDGDCYLRLVCEARYSRFWMQVFIPEKLVGGMFHFAEELNSCSLTPCERIILCAIQLTSKEHERMKNPMRVRQLHDYYLDLLAYQIEQTHKSNHSRVLIKIFQLLPMLSPISRESLELTSVMRLDQPPEVTSSSQASAEIACREPSASFQSEELRSLLLRE